MPRRLPFNKNNKTLTLFSYDWDTIDAWSRPGESASWQLEVMTPGRYEVILSYGCSQADAGGVLRVSAGDGSVEHVIADLRYNFLERK